MTPPSSTTEPSESSDSSHSHPPLPSDDLAPASEEPEGPPGLPRLAQRIAPHLETAQTVSAFVAGAALLLGFLASIDVLLLPRGNETLAWALHPVLFVLGTLGGVAAAVRGRQADKVRWSVLDDPMLTDGERQLAHQEAERQRRWAATVFFVTPILLGYWLAYQCGDEDSRSLVPPLLIASPMAGFLLGLLLTQWMLGPEKKPY